MYSRPTMGQSVAVACSPLVTEYLAKTERLGEVATRVLQNYDQQRGVGISCGSVRFEAVYPWHAEVSRDSQLCVNAGI